MDREQDDRYWRRRGLGGGRIQQKDKRTHGHGQQCGDCRGKGVHES